VSAIESFMELSLENVRAWMAGELPEGQVLTGGG